MTDIFSKFKDKFLGRDTTLEDSSDYVEIDTNVDRGPKAKIIVRPFFIEDFADIKPVLDALREGTTIALINIRPLKEKDIIEVKRAVSKLKKTCDAIEGDIAGFGEDWIVVTPSFAQIHRSTQTAPVTSESQDMN
ncbi:MAG: cell division protein SepF [Nanoarchaeota archaeon]